MAGVGAVRVLVACEYSGRVRDAFLAKGHDALSCDMEPTESEGPHHQGDVTELLNDGWDLMVAHPPCTYLCNSGVRWLYGGKGDRIDPDRWGKMVEGIEFFLKLAKAPIPLIAIENPIPHQFARQAIGRPFQVIQPWMFGDGETKATGLWLKGLMPLRPWDEVEGRTPAVHREPPGPDRWKNRSRTYKGIANAMADQWG